MRAALYLWRRRLRWVLLVSLLLAVLAGVYVYLALPPRYEAVAEVLMLREGAQAQDALAEESIRWSRYDALQEASLTAAQWDGVTLRVQRLGRTSILLVKARAQSAAAAADAANALSATLIHVINTSAGAQALKSVVLAGVPQAPVFLYRELWIAAALIGSFALLGIITLAWCVCKPVLIRSRDIRDAAALPVLAEIPDLRGVTDAFDRFDPADRPPLYDFAGFYTHEQLRLLTLVIRHQAKEQTLKSLALVSRTDQEFRQELAVMLSQELCRQGSRVLLVDMNWYQPQLGELLQAKGEHDLIHCLASNIPFEQAIVQTRMRGLYFLDQNHSRSMAAQLSASASFAAFLEAMYAKFDFILFDMPPAGLFTDALAISGVVHAVLPVVRAKRWTPAQVRQWAQPLQALAGSVPGVAVSNAAIKQPRTHRKLDETAGF